MHWPQFWLILIFCVAKLKNVIEFTGTWIRISLFVCLLSCLSLYLFIYFSFQNENDSEKAKFDLKKEEEEQSNDDEY